MVKVRDEYNYWVLTKGWLEPPGISKEVNRPRPHWTSSEAEAATQPETEEWRGKGDSNPQHQLWKERGMEDTPCVFKESLDAEMAHFLWLANVLF